MFQFGNRHGSSLTVVAVMFQITHMVESWC